MVRNIVTFLGLFLLLSVGVVAAGDSEKEKAAVAAAEEWFTMVDHGKYVESWKEAAQYLQKRRQTRTMGAIFASCKESLRKTDFQKGQ